MPTKPKRRKSRAKSQPKAQDSERHSAATTAPHTRNGDEWMALLQSGEQALASGRVKDAAVLLKEAVEHARRDEVPGAEASGLGLLAQALLATGDPTGAATAARQALAIAERLKDAGATSHFRQLVEMAEQHANPEARELATAFQEGVEAANAGDHRTAQAAFHRAHALATALGAKRDANQARLAEGQAALMGGDDDTARGAARELIERAEADGDDELGGLAKALLAASEAGAGALALPRAQAALHAGDHGTALEILETLQRDSADLDGGSQVALRFLLAQAQAATGEREEGRRTAEAGLEIVMKLGLAEPAAALQTLLVALSDPDPSTRS